MREMFSLKVAQLETNRIVCFRHDITLSYLLIYWYHHHDHDFTIIIEK